MKDKLFSRLNCIWLEDKKNFLSTEALEFGMVSTKEDDYLLTLPTSKDQLIFNGLSVNGHTEFFRKFYKLEEVSMTFLSHNSNFLLLTDHIAIDEVTDKIKDTKYCLKKIENCIEGLPKNRKIKEIFIAGINPHAGESGLISKNDIYIDEIVSALREKYQITIHDKVAGDTIQFNIKSKNQLFIFPFHDQGLGIFKSLYGLYGINYSLGMPIKRISVDHGTAFNLYGKNEANYNGMLYLLKELQQWA